MSNPQYGGALFILPREVRDEIYRLVVKRDYIIYVTLGDDEVSIRPTKDKHYFAILEVSKTLSDEASDILYSESLFKFSIDFSAHGIFCVPTPLTKRMKNVEFRFGGLSTWHSDLFSPNTFLTYQNHINTICHAVIADFTGAEIVRNNLRIRLSVCGPGMISTLSVHIFQGIKALIGFRTIVLEVFPLCPVSILVWHMGFRPKVWGLSTQELIQTRRGLQDILEPTLGSAIQYSNGDVFCLTFRPREHILKSTMCDGKSAAA